jgi:hypothetical protein
MMHSDRNIAYTDDSIDTQTRNIHLLTQPPVSSSRFPSVKQRLRANNPPTQTRKPASIDTLNAHRLTAIPSTTSPSTSLNQHQTHRPHQPSHYQTRRRAPQCKSYLH